MIRHVSDALISLHRLSHRRCYTTGRTWLLRPYQQAAIEAVYSLWKENHVHRQVVSLPVGSGKTVVFAHLIQRLQEVAPKKKVLVLAHREELLLQARATIERYNPRARTALERGKEHAEVGLADVVIASVPTLGRQHSTRLQKFDPAAFGCVIIDEAHHATASTYVRILEHFHLDQPDAQVDRPLLVGFSATVLRHDGVRLGQVFDYLAFHLPLADMMQQQWLCALRVTTVKTKTSLNEVETLGPTGDFKVDQLGKAVNQPIRNELVVQTWQAYPNAKSTLVFAVDLAHVDALQKAFLAIHVDARCITGATPAAQRQSDLQAFKARLFPVLINCGVLTEGTDIPNIDCLLMARPTRSPVLFQQMVGRGLRLFPDKKMCMVFDFVDAFSPSSGALGLVTMPTLLGLDSSSLLQDHDVTLTEEKEAATSEMDKEEPMADYSPASFDDVTCSDPFDPFAVDGTGSSTASERHQLYQLSPFAWIWMQEGEFLLNVVGTAAVATTTTPNDAAIKGSERLLRVYREEGMYKAEWHTKVRRQFPRASKEKKEVITTQHLYKEAIPIAAATLDHLIAGLHSLIPPFAPSSMKYLHRKSPWRSSRASEAQIKYLAKLGFSKQRMQAHALQRHAESYGHLDAQPVITKGMAMDYITWVNQGGKRQWEERLKKRAKIMKEEAEKEKREIKVGPLSRRRS